MTYLQRCLLCLVAGFALLPLACEKKSAITSKTATTDVPTQATEAGMLTPLDRDPDFNRCRAALQQLDSVDQPSIARVEIPSGDLDSVGKFLNLTRGERAELSQSSFNQHDAAYLEEAILIRNGVRSMDIESKSVPIRAQATFDWICRMVYVSERVTWITTPWLTLQAGTGLPLSRDYAILAAWQQASLDGCLIGPPQLKDSISLVPPKGPNEKPIYAPIRLCGVINGKDTLLFDPQAGKAVLGANGKAIATLSEVIANPDLVKGIATADEVKTWQIYLSPPLASLSSRMAWLQKLDPGNVDVVLYSKTEEIRQQLKLDQPNIKVDGWNTADDKQSPVRIQMLYAEREESEQKTTLLMQTKVKVSPMEMLPQTNLKGQAYGWVGQMFGGRFLALRYTLHSPQDSLLRGDVAGAISVLNGMRSSIDVAKNKADRNPKLIEEFEKWADELQSLTADKVRAERSKNGQQLAQVSQAINNFMSTPRSREIEQSVILGLFGGPLNSEVLYLLALSVQDRAERQLVRGGGKPNWQSAIDWWDRYLEASSQVNGPFAARDQHARALRERGLKMSQSDRKQETSPSKS
jgi:hypothetical protein